MIFEFYTESFDINKPPPSPPNRDMTHWLLFGWIETKKSKKRGKEYLARLEEWENRRKRNQ